MALSQGWMWPAGWKPICHCKKWEHNWEREKAQKPRTLSGYFHSPCPCSFRNYSFYPTHNWYITYFLLSWFVEPQASLSTSFGDFIHILFSYVLKPARHKALPWEKWKINTTVCQSSNKVGQCVPISVMSSRAPRVSLCFGNHTVRKSNKQ